MSDSAPHRPQGYRHLGLWSAEVGTLRSNSSAARLAGRVAAAGGGEVVGLDRVPTALAFEYAHVWLGLSRSWPGVAPGVLDTSAALGRLLGRTELPDAGSAAVVQLSACLGHGRCRRGTVAEWSARRDTSLRRGSTLFVPEFRTTLPTLVMVHEFAHLVDAAVWDLGGSWAERVYRELSTELLGTRPASTEQWAGHLVNYPSWSLPQGPACGGARRAAVRRRSLRPPVGGRLGRYALVSREELFAESFAFAVCGSDPSLAGAWRRIRSLLAPTGLARPVRRRP